MTWAGHVACMCEISNVLEKPEGKRQLGRQRHIWEDNIKVDLGKIG
jgi:hypothetical protein